MTKNPPSSKKKYCNRCQAEVQTAVQVLSQGPHWAKETCTNCGRFVGFLQKPKNRNKRVKGKHKPSTLDISHCQMCLRPSTRLGSRGILEIHHVTEIQAGGEDTPQNIWVVCTSCHRLIHHQRTYLNDHPQRHYSIQDLQVDMDRNNVPKGAQGQLKRIFKLQEAANARDHS